MDFLRSDANTCFPESLTLGGDNFLTSDFAADHTHGFVSYTGSWTGASLDVSLNHGTTYWSFVNEAQFQRGTSEGSGDDTPKRKVVAGFPRDSRL